MVDCVQQAMTVLTEQSEDRHFGTKRSYRKNSATLQSTRDEEFVRYTSPTGAISNPAPDIPAGGFRPPGATARMEMKQQVTGKTGWGVSVMLFHLCRHLHSGTTA